MTPTDNDLSPSARYYLYAKAKDLAQGIALDSLYFYADSEHIEDLLNLQLVREATPKEATNYFYREDTYYFTDTGKAHVNVLSQICTIDELCALKDQALNDHIRLNQ